jgi:hypothetical protein
MRQFAGFTMANIVLHSCFMVHVVACTLLACLQRGMETAAGGFVEGRLFAWRRLVAT